MKHLAILLAATSLMAASAHAADKPIIAPAPSWVVAAGALPAPKKDSEAPIELLRSDQQVKLEKGRQTVYIDVAMRIVTPQGLAAGNISFPWRPETDELTVHKLASGSYAQAIVKFPDNTQLLTGRGLAYDQLGDHAAAQKDFANARAKASQPVMLNNICWKKATFPAASASILESALVDCDSALKQSQDNPAYLDSRGLVFLRLGRLDEAIRDYDKVLSGSGDYATSLYGRALALAQKGDAQRAQLDRTAAIKLIDSIVDDFKDYGLPWPGEAH